MFFDENSSFYKFYKEYTNYDGSWRQGDNYVKEMFQAGIITYYDKFGEVDFEEKSKELYKWAYVLRLKLSRVSYLSINKYVKQDNQFEKIAKSYYPYELFKVSSRLPDEIKMEIPKVKNFYKK